MAHGGRLLSSAAGAAGCFRDGIRRVPKQESALSQGRAFLGAASASAVRLEKRFQEPGQGVLFAAAPLVQQQRSVRHPPADAEPADRLIAYGLVGRPFHIREERAAAHLSAAHTAAQSADRSPAQNTSRRANSRIRFGAGES